jgi:hypothetical protein
MTKSEVYSWRLSRDTKAALEIEARRKGESLGALLDRITADWLAGQHEMNSAGAAEQARLHAISSQTIGRIAGARPGRSASVKRDLRARLRLRRAARKA